MIKRTRVVDRSIFLVSGQQRNFAILRFVLFFIFLAHSTIAKFLAGRLKGKRSLTDRRTQFRSPLDERSGNNRDKQIFRAATTQWNNVQPRSATDESISILFSLRKASILEKCSYNKIEQLLCVESCCGLREIEIADIEIKKEKKKKEKNGEIC